MHGIVSLVKNLLAQCLCDTGDSQKRKTTVFNDPIHGHISLPDVCVRIINTPEFLRLRHIKQLGATYGVFPGASHNRFEHCIGVAFLAGEFGNILKKQIDEELDEIKRVGSAKEEGDYTEEMKITENDIRCLQVAGLCHDLGHGPMSHAFESKFARIFNPKWNHEDASCKLFEKLIKENKIQLEEGEHDKEFIKNLIRGNKENYAKTGRPKERNFLYEIVSNSENGIDVDKFDYLARDCHHLGFKSNFDHKRLMTFSRVIQYGDDWHIGYREKQVEDIYHMFISRVILHRRACQHKTVQVLERMYMEALLEADRNSFTLQLKNGKFKISDIIIDMDMKAYVSLTDNIFVDIRNSPDPKLRGAQDILKKIDERKLYKLASAAIPLTTEPFEHDEEKIMEDVVRFSHDQLKEEDLLVEIAEFGYGGKKGINPVDRVYFYNKPMENGSHRAFHIRREKLSNLLPAVYSEKRVRLYIKDYESEVKLNEARKSFRKWCKINRMNDRASWQ